MVNLYFESSGRKGLALSDVVVIIIMLFVGINLLIPVIGVAGEKDQRVVCANNMRKIASAIGMYTAEWEYYPPTNLNPESADWAAGSPSWHLYLITGGTGFGTEAAEKSYGLAWNNITCPAMLDYAKVEGVPGNAIRPETSYYRTGSHYGLNIRVGGWPGNIYDFSRTSRRKAELIHPGETILVAETWNLQRHRPFYRTSPTYTESEARGVVWPVHESAAGVLWADGHTSHVDSPNPADRSTVYEVLTEDYWKVNKFRGMSWE